MLFIPSLRLDEVPAIEYFAVICLYLTVEKTIRMTEIKLTEKIVAYFGEKITSLLSTITINFVNKISDVGTKLLHNSSLHP